jgi:glucose/mannose-6-phosphate isomerase
MEEIDLDDLKIYPPADPENMLARIRELPEQCRRAWRQAMDFDLPPGYDTVDKVVILGMGGSAIGGDLVKDIIEAEAGVPVIVHRGYGLPAFVDGRTLIITSSYSGNTEETLSGFEPSLKTGARVLAVTTGGRVKEMAEANGVPVFKIDYAAQPRAALGFSFVPTLGILQKLGFIADKASDLAETVDVLETLVTKLDEKSPQVSNPAKQLAHHLHGKLAVVYGAGILAGAAHRWKTQLNENGKAWAFYEVFPELNHNATVGYPFPTELIDKIRVVLLRSALFSERIKLRYEVTCELLGRAGVGYDFVDGVGESPLSQMMSAVMTGDFTSYYLAVLNRVDPTPVEAISYLKDRLAKG